MQQNKQDAYFALVGKKTIMLGLVGTTKNGTTKWELHIDPDTRLVCVKQETGYPIGQMSIETALKMDDERWQCAGILGKAYLTKLFNFEGKE